MSSDEREPNGFLDAMASQPPRLRFGGSEAEVAATMALHETGAIKSWPSREEQERRKTAIRQRLVSDALFRRAVDEAVSEVYFLFAFDPVGQQQDYLRWATALAVDAAERLGRPETPDNRSEATRASHSAGIEPSDDAFVSGFEAGRSRGGWEAEVSPEPEPPDLDEALAAWRAERDQPGWLDPSVPLAERERRFDADLERQVAERRHEQPGTIRPESSDPWEAMQQRAREAGLRPGEVINNENFALARLRRDAEQTETCTCGRRLQPLPISGLLICPPCGYKRGRCLCDVVQTVLVHDGVTGEAYVGTRADVEQENERYKADDQPAQRAAWLEREVSDDFARSDGIVTPPQEDEQ